MNLGARVESIDLAAKRGLVRILERQNEVLRFDDNPVLASLCACLGLQFEMGYADYDRLSPFFGVDVVAGMGNPWRSEVFSTNKEFGVRFERKDGLPLQLRHRDLRFIIDGESFDPEGNLTRIVIYPARVARMFQQRGFDLVIVRDWLLSSSLNLDQRSRVAYLFANQWEIENNIGRMQSQLLANRQLAFSGTHDIADHLLGSDATAFSEFSTLFEDCLDTIDRVLSRGKQGSASQLTLSYLVGVLLDDLAQPRWYGSEKHSFVIREALRLLPETPADGREEILALPDSFHALVAGIRDGKTEIVGLPFLFRSFWLDLGARQGLDHRERS